MSCVIEPRKGEDVEAEAVERAEGETEVPKDHGGHVGSTGVEERSA
jgi:hypothetical protein